jgi:hypothetical protein
MSEDHHFLINGMRWLVRFTRLRGRAAGWAYLPDANNPFSERKILVDSRLKNRAKLETVVHEILHVCYPTVSEEHITLSARDLARALWALGYREKE